MNVTSVSSRPRGIGRGAAFLVFALVLVATAALTRKPKEFVVDSVGPAVTSLTSTVVQSSVAAVYNPLDSYQSFVIAVRLDVARCAALAGPKRFTGDADLWSCVLAASESIEKQVRQTRQTPSSSKGLDQAVFEFGVRALQDLRSLTRESLVSTNSADSMDAGITFVTSSLRLKDLGTFVLYEACNGRKDCLLERQAPVRAMEHAGLI